MPTTLDEATADPPAVAVDARVDARANLGKTLLEPSPFSQPTAHPSSQLATPLVPPPYDPEARPTTAPEPSLEDQPRPKADNLAKTLADPEIAERARQLRDAALTQLGHAISPPATVAPTPPPAPSLPTPVHASPSPGVPAPAAATASPQASRAALGRTAILGGDGGPPNPLVALDPNRAPDREGSEGRPASDFASTPRDPGTALPTRLGVPLQAHPGADASTPAIGVPSQASHVAPAPHVADASPLSRSVAVPSSWRPPPPVEGQLQPAPVFAAQPVPAAAASHVAPTQAMGAFVPPPNVGSAGQGAPTQAPTQAMGAFAPPPSAAPTPAPANLSSDKRTMLGMSAKDLPIPPPPQTDPRAAAVGSPLKTIMGVAIPGIAPTHDPPRDRSAHGTMIGVAAPGIAPMHQPAPHAPQAPHHGYRGGTAMLPEVPLPPPPALVPAPAPLLDEPLPEAPLATQKRGIPAVAVVGIVFVLVAILGVGAFFLFLRSSAPLTAQPQLDDTGRESLKIACTSCPDGTTVALGASSATVTSSATLLTLPAPLAIGENDLTLKVDRPGTGRDEDVKIHVPVAYRVRADLTSLSAKPPAITVRVEAGPGAVVTVEGQPVTLDASGRGAHAIDVTESADGPSDDIKTIDRKLAFTIQPKGKPVENGQLVARASIVPLHLDAPGTELMTDRATAAVSGQTRAGATVTVDGAPAPVDEKGVFAVRTELPASGTKELTIIANAPPLGPRTVHAKVIRVASLDAAAKELDAKSPLPFDQFSVDPNAKKGQSVVVEGEIVDARVLQGQSVVLLDDKKHCAKGASCLVRVEHGEEIKATRGEAVRAYGRVVGTVTAGGKTVPDVTSVLVMPVPKSSAGSAGK